MLLFTTAATLLSLTGPWMMPVESAAVLSLGHRYAAECQDLACSKMKFNRIADDETSSDDDMHLVKRSANTVTYNTQSDNGMIKYNIYCTADSTQANAATICNNVKDAFRQSGNYLTNVFKLSTPITVQAVIHDFCQAAQASGDANGLASCNLALGYGKPSNMWQITADGLFSVRDVLFPQALVRHKAVSSGYSLPSSMSSVDIMMEFNTVFQSQYYFDTGSGTNEAGQSIQSGQYDFIYIVLHEQIHGLGMVTAYTQALQDVPTSVQNQYSSALAAAQLQVNNVVMPPLILNNAQTRVTNVQPVTIFDYFLGGTGSDGTVTVTVWYPLLTAITSWFTSNTGQSTAVSNLVTINNAVYTNDKVVFAFPPSVIVPTAPDKTIVIQSGPPYQQGTSLCHVDMETYTNTEDFLMRPAQNDGVALKQQMQQYGGPLKPFGRNTVKIMVSLGYEISTSASSLMNTSFAGQAGGGNAQNSEYGWAAIAVPMLVALFTM